MAAWAQVLAAWNDAELLRGWRFYHSVYFHTVTDLHFITVFSSYGNTHPPDKSALMLRRADLSGWISYFRRAAVC